MARSAISQIDPEFDMDPGFDGSDYLNPDYNSNQLDSDEMIDAGFEKFPFNFAVSTQICLVNWPTS